MTKPEQLKEKLPSLWRISRYFWPHVRQHQGLIAGSMFALFAEVGLRLLEPWPLKVVFDRVLGHGRGRCQWFPIAWQDADPVTALLPLTAKVLIVAGMGALMALLNWKLALLAFSILPLFWLRTVTLTRRIQEVAKKQRRQEGA